MVRWHKRRGRRRWARALVRLLPTIVCIAPIVATGLATSIGDASERRVIGRAAGPVTTTGTGRCTDCHRPDNGLSHPVNVRPSMPMPDGFALPGGQMTCVTCHLEADPTTHGLMVGQGALLRGQKRGAAFCARCHETGRRGVSHAARLTRAHLAWPDRSAKPTWAGAPWGAPLDSLSRECMSCHDGSRGTDIGRSHPMGIPYGSPTAARNPRERQPAQLVPLERLDPRIRLLENRVGCASCHDPFDTRAAMLVMPNDRDQLCTSCHDLR